MEKEKVYSLEALNFKLSLRQSIILKVMARHGDAGLSVEMIIDALKDVYGELIIGIPDDALIHESILGALGRMQMLEVVKRKDGDGYFVVTDLGMARVAIEKRVLLAINNLF